MKQTYYNITQKDIKAHVADCQWCNRSNANRNLVDDVIPILSSKVNERWVIDTTYMIELEETNDGYKYIATGMDHFSKFPFAIPLKGRSARDVSFQTNINNTDDSLVGSCFSKALLSVRRS